MGKKEKKEKEHHVPKGPTAMELLNLPPEKPILDDVPQYNKEQLRMLQEIFDAFDVEKEGFVSLNVIPFTLSTLDVKMKEEEMQALIKEIDDNGSGKIELNEYIELAKRYIEPEDDVNKVRDELREVFMIFDKTNKGYLEIPEFKAIIKEIEPDLPDKELDDIVEEVDADGSGRIEFEEFLQVMVGE